MERWKDGHTISLNVFMLQHFHISIYFFKCFHIATFPYFHIFMLVQQTYYTYFMSKRQLNQRLGVGDIIVGNAYHYSELCPLGANNKLSQNRHLCVQVTRKMWSLVSEKGKPASQWAGVFLSKKVKFFIVKWYW